MNELWGNIYKYINEELLRREGKSQSLETRNNLSVRRMEQDG
jgi:hypothetical protein